MQNAQYSVIWRLVYGSNQLCVFRALSLHIVVCIIMAAVAILCIIASREKESTAVYAIVIGIFLIIYVVTSVVPLVKDYITQDVIRVDATYINTVGDQSKTTSSRLGEYSVLLVTEQGNIKLTTVPFSSDIFPTGEYAVTAWYAHNSERLLFIEIHDTRTED